MRTAKLSESSEADHLLPASTHGLQPLGVAVFSCNLVLALIMLANVIMMQEGSGLEDFMLENTTTETTTTVTTSTLTRTTTLHTATFTTTPMSDIGRLAAATARHEGKVLCGGVDLPFLGVNIGGWLVMEDDLWPTEMKDKGILDEWSFIHALGGPKSGQAVKAMKEHWETFVTDKDLDDLKRFGVTHVRVPVGYWLVDYSEDDGYVYRGQLYLFRFLAWLKQRNMRAVIALQAVPGGQAAGTSSTGRRTWEPGFFLDSKKYERGQDAMYKLAEWIVQMNENVLTEGVIVGLELLNEPDWQFWSRTPGIRDLYTVMIPKLRKLLPASECSFLLNFQEPILDEGLHWLKTMRRMHPEDYTGVFYDAHISHAGSGSRGNQTVPLEADTCKTCCRDPVLLKPLEVAVVPSIIGQYSLDHRDSNRPASLAYFRNQLALWKSMPGVLGSFFWNHRVLREPSPMLSNSSNHSAEHAAPARTPAHASPLSLLDLIAPGGPLSANGSHKDVTAATFCVDQDLDKCPMFDSLTVTWTAECQWLSQDRMMLAT